ncbi:LuxR C-terminal-related transcriptional regulator [Streptomyces sp. ME19-01-6]|uniref:LuxR C-terminal-related transcriptional regulator n=1 Tax=Streptomyces sp. ME19-01-6 TaxID=3028686 RepID=UPI0029B5639C|nr:LuxR C-terminal-related transcriptional regulator [Streptomyces sp. ME19-01-6]MDX3233187.1 LuxR C-terminal-related transcriptional regulator [Streptomyces sp. ME19-01-6]
MPSHQDMYLRPDDGDAYRQALRLARARTAVPVVFAGDASSGSLNLSHFMGTRTMGLRGLTVRAEAGLGGLVLARGRPAGVSDYGTTRWITHDYDAEVLAEGISSVIAVPVVVSGAVRGVLYGATREAGALGDRTTEAFLDAARRLSQELAVRDEVDRRLQLRDALGTGAGATGEFPVEEVRELHAELRVLAQAARNKELRDRLLKMAQRLAALGDRQPPTVRLSPRELDVLAQVALGCSNAEAGERLSLQPETVKAYLRSAMAKLGTHTRFEAVVAARRARLLP